MADKKCVLNAISCALINENASLRLKTEKKNWIKIYPIITKRTKKPHQTH